MELLVVISIIALLVSLTLSVVQSVRASAHGVACLSNLRQMSMSIIYYANDNGGFVPVSQFENHDHSRFPLIIAANILVNRGTLYNDMKNVLICPGDGRRDSNHGAANAGGLNDKSGFYADTNLDSGLQWIRTSYCYSDDVFAQRYYPRKEDPVTKAEISDGCATPTRLARASSNMAMFWDSWNNWSRPSNNDIFGFSRHRSGINMTFPDGSARFYDFAPSLHGEAWNYVNWSGSNAVYTYWGPTEPRRLLGPNAGAKWMDNLNGEPWK